MHEMTIAVELLEQLQMICGEHGVTKIDRVFVQVGRLRQIVPEALDLAFASAAEGTPAEGATIELEVVPTTVRCRACGAEHQPPPDSFLCPTCGQADAEILSGNDIFITSIEAEAPLPPQPE